MMEGDARCEPEVPMSTQQRTVPKNKKKASGVHSEAQIMRLSLEFRKLQKDLKSTKKRADNYMKSEQEKVFELLNNEDIPFRDHFFKDSELQELSKEEEIDLLLTNGKIDLDKVLCLHVFSISQPYKCPKEKVNDPNLRITPLVRYSEYLPCFLMKPVDSQVSCLCWERQGTTLEGSDRPMTCHLQVNSQIERMIHAVTTALKNLNPAKLKKLSQRAQSVEQIQCTLQKPDNHIFISSLLHSKFIQDRAKMRAETCTVMEGKTHLIQDIGKFKKNLVFSLEIPEVLSEMYEGFASKRGPAKPLPAKNLAESSFEQLLQIKRHVSSNVSIIPGYQLLQKGPSTGGIAVIDQSGSSISYLAGEPTQRKRKNITIVMQSPQITDHEYVVDKMTEMDREVILARPRNRVEEVSLKIAQRNIGSKLALDDANHELMKEQILKKLSNEERIAVAQKAAKMKTGVVNSEGESQPVSIAKLLKDTVERHRLLKLVRDSSDVEREILFKPSKQGGLGIGELLVDENDLTVMTQLEDVQLAKNVAIVKEECNYRAPKKLNVGIDSQFGILKIEHEVSKKEIMKSCKMFERQLQKKQAK